MSFPWKLIWFDFILNSSYKKSICDGYFHGVTTSELSLAQKQKVTMSFWGILTGKTEEEKQLFTQKMNILNLLDAKRPISPS